MSDDLSFDVMIIGGGPAGYTAAVRAGQLGFKAAIVDARETLGGTCLNVGCIPAKSLLRSSELFETAKLSFTDIGIEVPAPRLNLSQMMKAKATAVSELARGVDFLMRKNKVTRLLGWARILGPGQVAVKDPAGKETILAVKNIVIATGSEVTPLPGVTVDQARIVDSDGAIAFGEVPKSLIVIGAGIVGLELGSVWRRLGSQVTVIEYLDHIAPGMDGEVGRTFQRLLEKQGMVFRLATKVTGAAASATEVTLTVEPAAGGQPETLSAERVLVAIGRRPFTKELGLETVGISLDTRGFIPTNKFKTSAPGVWAIGDVIAGPMLAHKAEDDAVACIELIAGKAGHVDYDLVPAVVYTRPEVAWVGSTEDRLKESGVGYKVGKFPFTANSRARINHETEGYVKILAAADTGRILGVHAIGPEVSEMIAEACVIMAFAGTSEDLARTLHPHPTRSEAIRQAAMDVEHWATQM